MKTAQYLAFSKHNTAHKSVNWCMSLNFPISLIWLAPPQHIPWWLDFKLLQAELSSENMSQGFWESVSRFWIFISVFFHLAFIRSQDRAEDMFSLCPGKYIGLSSVSLVLKSWKDFLLFSISFLVWLLFTPKFLVHWFAVFLVSCLVISPILVNLLCIFSWWFICSAERWSSTTAW